MKLNGKTQAHIDILPKHVVLLNNKYLTPPNTERNKMADKEFFTFEEIQTHPRTHLFLVFAETKPGVWVNVKATNNRQSAIFTANFWDERVNVEFIDTNKELMQKKWEEQQEAERVAALPISDQLDISLAKQIAHIDKRANEIIASI